MLDPLSKKILKHMCAQQNPSQKKYDFDTDLANLAEAVSIDREVVRGVVRHLEEREYIKYLKDQKGRTYAFYSDYKGLQWKDFRRQEILIYFLEKWPEIFSVLVSVVSLVLSIVALCSAQSQPELKQ